MYEIIKNTFGWSRTFGLARSSSWESVRDNFILQNPVCAVCGTRKDLDVHHIQPFHLDPNLELDPNNLITLCRPHHYLFGHFNDWKSFNIQVVEDAKLWAIKINKRPCQI